MNDTFFTLSPPLFDFSIISELVEDAILQDKDLCSVDNAHKVFWSILEADELDIRDKKAAIIDFIAAGIKTVRIICYTYYPSMIICSLLRI